MDEITKPHNLEEIKQTDDHHFSMKKKFNNPFTGEHKHIFVAVGVVIVVLMFMSFYINKKIETAIAKHDTNKRTQSEDLNQLDAKISTAINNYNSQLQPRFMDLERKVADLYASTPTKQPEAKEATKPRAVPKTSANVKTKIKSAKTSSSKRVPTSTKSKKK